MSEAAALGTIPADLRVREAGSADLERLVEFGNRRARPTRWQDIGFVRIIEQGNPQPNRLWLMVEDAAGAIVASGQTTDGGTFRASEGAYRTSIRVDPDWARRGIGSHLLARLEGHAQRKEAPKSQTSVHGDEADGLTFATAHGYVEYHRRIEYYLDVATFAPQELPSAADAEARSGARFAPYRVVASERGTALEAFQRELYDFINTQSRDIPRPGTMPEPPPFEAVRAMFFSGNTFDEGATLVALRSERIVGVTITTLNPQGTAYTQFTGTARDERGKGIALAMKLRVIEELRRKGAKLFGTTNDPANAAMRGINARLGYVPEPPLILLEKKLT